ncbi:hypothetical protein DL769_008561 [Monosporascus sp. CRB-8-3]|nr:hypothetical protein DL769_008561 [Monosporascus sp. CRB-8-3]
MARGRAPQQTLPTPPPQPLPAEPSTRRRQYLGLEVLYDPEQVGLGPTELDIAFVHGLNGDHIRTWRHEDTGIVWPEDLIPKVMPSFRVLSFGYSAHVYDNVSLAHIRDHARNLLNLLNDERAEIPPERPVVFVAHSLGGLVVKQALRLANNEAPFKLVAKATRGILLFSTPHHGADEEKWLRIAEGFAPLAPPNPDPSGAQTIRNPLVDALKRESRDVLEISEDFRFLACSYALVSFYELHVWPGTREQIVHKSSALLNLEHERQVPLEANHADMCRFDGLKDPLFVQVVKRIKDAANGGPVDRGNEGQRGVQQDTTTTRRGISQADGGRQRVVRQTEYAGRRQ